MFRRFNRATRFGFCRIRGKRIAADRIISAGKRNRNTLINFLTRRGTGIIFYNNVNPKTRGTLTRTNVRLFNKVDNPTSTTITSCLTKGLHFSPGTRYSRRSRNRNRRYNRRRYNKRSYNRWPVVSRGPKTVRRDGHSKIVLYLEEANEDRNDTIDTQPRLLLKRGESTLNLL